MSGPQPASREPSTSGAPDRRTVLLSVHPRYAELILAGLKVVELRRRFSPEPDQLALLYATMPVAAVIGSVRVVRTDRLPVDEIWRTHGGGSAVTSAEFAGYFGTRDAGCALLLADPRRFDRVVPLAELRSRHGLGAPQSYAVLNGAHRALVRHERE